MKIDESKTKIIATIGPASESKEVLREMFLAGVDVCRLNFSHGTHEKHEQTITLIRELNKELNVQVAILADLQGPKLRIGEIENGSIELIEGNEIKIVTEKCIGTQEQVYLGYKEFPFDVTKDDFILIDDGKIKLRVIETDKKDTVRAKIIHGGILSSRKGVNLPDTKITLPSLTEKDIKDAIFALEHNVDWIALSFVRTVTDIIELKQLIRRRKKHASVVAKIEKPEALTELHNIVDLSDGIMVARGDLGVEVDFQQVPLIQKEIVKKCIALSKPVIIATQMLESMITNFRPTRAEATDVANAVLDGADTLMLSGETSVGENPVQVIESMHKIIQYTEDKAYHYNRGNPPKEFSRTFLEDSVCYHAAKMANQSEAKAIIAFTHSGYTAYRIAGYRPKADIFVFTSNKTLIPKISLLWGAKAFYFSNYENIDNAIDFSIKMLLDIEEINDGDIVVHIASTPLQGKDRTNMLKISYV